MADTPQGISSFFGNVGLIDPKKGNNRRKHLLQLLTQKAHAAGGQGHYGSAPVAAGAGVRGIAKHRDSQGQNFTHPSRVAAQFLGGLGVGSRPGADDTGNNGNPISRFLPSDGGPVERRVHDPSPPEQAQADVTSDFAPGTPADVPADFPADTSAAAGVPQSVLDQFPNVAPESTTPDAPVAYVDNPTDPFAGAVIDNTTQSSTFAAPPLVGTYSAGDVVPAYSPTSTPAVSIANDPNNADSAFFTTTAPAPAPVYTPGTIMTPGMNYADIGDNAPAPIPASEPTRTLAAAQPPAPAPAPEPAPAPAPEPAPSSTPTSGASQMIPLGNGAYYDPTTQTLRFPNTGVYGI